MPSPPRSADVLVDMSTLYDPRDATCSIQRNVDRPPTAGVAAYYAEAATTRPNRPVSLLNGRGRPLIPGLIARTATS